MTILEKNEIGIKKEWYSKPTQDVACKVAKCVDDAGVALFPADTV
ncbi:hypothetical protein [Candidatus Enterovibrio escicola]|nr:hypothetical protein [Candidatus Enterovibrio escacola]